MFGTIQDSKRSMPIYGYDLNQLQHNQEDLYSQKRLTKRVTCLGLSLASTFTTSAAAVIPGKQIILSLF